MELQNYENEAPDQMKKWYLGTILEGQCKIMLYFTLIWGDLLYRINVAEKRAENVHICVYYLSVNSLLTPLPG